MRVKQLHESLRHIQILHINDTVTLRGHGSQSENVERVYSITGTDCKLTDANLGTIFAKCLVNERGHLLIEERSENVGWDATTVWTIDRDAGRMVWTCAFRSGTVNKTFQLAFVKRKERENEKQ